MTQRALIIEKGEGTKRCSAIRNSVIREKKVKREPRMKEEGEKDSQYHFAHESTLFYHMPWA